MPLTSKAFKNLITTHARTGTLDEPRCPHAERCGGCAFQERAYADQVASKAAALRDVWADLSPAIVPAVMLADLDVVPSPDPYNYRTRMDYVATKGRFGLRMRGRFNYIIELETCHLIPPAAFHVAHRLWLRSRELGLPDYNVRSHEGFLRYIVVRRSPQDTFMLAAVTAAGDYQDEMAQLAELALAQPGVLGFHWLLNDSLTDLSFGAPLRHWGVETLPMQVGQQTLHIGPNSFFQNNVHLLLPLLGAVTEAVTSAPTPAHRVADLYSGVGAIALHLAQHVEHVTAVESHPESVALARQNSTLNGIANVSMHETDTLAYLRDQPAGSFDTLVADPPRTGLGPEVCTELLRIAPRRIVYVSCNPLTQHDDLQQLARVYRLIALRGYDMFPHTPHIETLAVLDSVTASHD